MNERLKSFKHLLIRSALALSLATLQSQPLQGSEQPQQEIVMDDHIEDSFLREALIQKIYQERGVEVIADYNPEISSALFDINPVLFEKPNYPPSLEILQTIDYVTNLIPAAGFLAQKIIVLPTVDPGINGWFNHNFQGEGLIVLLHNPNVPLTTPYMGSDADGNNYGSLLAASLAHEFGHGAHSNILSLQSFDLERYGIDWQYKFMNREDPVLRTYAQVAGFEYIEPEIVCDVQDIPEETTCQSIISFREMSFFLVTVRRNLQGWVRTPESLSQRQISFYARWSNISEAFAEDFAGYLFKPEFYNPSQRRYFENIFSGLALSEDPGSFLWLVSQYPEEILLDGVLGGL